MNDLINTLVAEGWSRETAGCWINANFRCVYCKMDFLESLDLYWLGVIDHLLPQSKFEHLSKEPTNMVLACRLCNYLKGRHVHEIASVHYQGEPTLSDEQRLALITGYKQFIEQKRAQETLNLATMLERATALRRATGAAIVDRGAPESAKR